LQTFRQALRSMDFVLTAELALDGTADRAAILAQAATLATEVDALQVADSAPPQSSLSPIAVGAMLLQAGIDPVVHLNCRDRNRLALRADVLGAAALGVSSLLLMRGKELADDMRPKVKTVYDWGTMRLIRFASSLERADFMIGSIATVFKPDRDWQPKQVHTACQCTGSAGTSAVRRGCALARQESARCRDAGKACQTSAPGFGCGAGGY